MNMKKTPFWILSLWAITAWAMPVRATDLLDEAVEQRFLMMDVPVAPVYDETARWYLRRYLSLGRYDASLMLGRAELWFPLIEQIFAAEGLPQSLKYLAVVESNLQPDALSEAGARGLWQFMPATARLYGLEVNAHRDERLDPWRATMAAARYLKDLYAEFGDWELALAAYNCGSGRVRQAIRAGGTRNYWHLRPYLPRQTSYYVPAFLAAAYVCQYYQLHSLEVRPVPEWMRAQARVLVRGRLSLRELSQATGVPLAVLQALNPAWPQGIVSAHQRSALVALPEQAVQPLRIWLSEHERPKVRFNIQPDAKADPLDRALLRLHRVRAGETIDVLAQKFGVSPEALRAWNLLAPDERLVPDCWIKVYQQPEMWRNA